MNKNSKGITLIALVVTIIVILILAGVSISSIDGQDGITNKATTAKQQTEISQEKEVISSSYISVKVKNEINANYDLITAEQLETSINRDFGTGTVEVTGNPENLMIKFLDSKRTYMIAQEGKYIADVTTALKSSKSGPIGVADDGSVVDMSNWSYMTVEGGYSLTELVSGYGPGYRGEIVNGRIVGKIPAYIMEDPESQTWTPVVELRDTFKNNSDLEYVPEIPSTVESMRFTFQNCSNLKDAGKIPFGITNMEGTFEGCKNLTNPPVIPDSVTGLESTFQYCENLEFAPTIPNSVGSLYCTFYGCKKLVDAPVIPASVVNMKYTFYGCTALKNAPDIPASVTDLYRTFTNCSNLTGTIKVDATLDLSPGYHYHSECFKNAATADGCELFVVGNGSNDTTINAIIGTKSSNSNIKKGE